MYGKIFASIYDGTLVGKCPWQALVTMEQFIILSDKDGVLDMTIDALVRRTGIPRDIYEIGIASLLEPDPESRTPTAEGRRIVPLDPNRAWGWIVVNKEQYGKIRDASDRRDYHRQYQRERRFSPLASDAENGSGAPDGSSSSLSTAVNNGNVDIRDVNNVNSDQQMLRHIDIDTDTDTDTKDKSKSVSSALQIVRRNALVEPLPSISGTRTHTAVRERLAAVTAEIMDGTRRRVTLEQVRTIQAELIFAFWVARMGHTNAKLDKKRERKLLTALEENGGDVSELLYVVDGALKDDWIMGRDPKSTKRYDGIETIFRDRAQIERLANNSKKFRDGIPHHAAVKYLSALSGGDDAISKSNSDSVR